jgi:heme a synthase
LSLATALLVILAGSIVRMTGSGMGCPDWPKCFGQYIPPTQIEQLPADYKMRFAVKGKEIADFDAFKTWVEYVNRLLGALLGVFVLGMVAASFALVFGRFRGRSRERSREYSRGRSPASPPESSRTLALLAFATLIVTGFVGWLGSVVVASDLQPVKITLHMLTALVILALCATIVFKAQPVRVESIRAQPENVAAAAQFSDALQPLRGLLLLALGLTLVQIVLGTQVREYIDELGKVLPPIDRERWISLLPTVFVIHRSFSLLVLVPNGMILWQAWQAWQARKSMQPVQFIAPAALLAALLVGEIVVGIVLAYFAVPKAAQPLHLLLATMIFTVQWWLVLQAFVPRRAVDGQTLSSVLAQKPHQKTLPSL